MKTYLVGGAVRDQLLGVEVKDRDWVVVGATPQDMLDLGYKQVGADFPVFLHPETGEEYALARTERKTGKGYHGFDVVADPTVTLEEDLRRRDLTINAMAMDEDGNVIDPFGGQEDLKNKILKPVSKAFMDDPVRILRVARFRARLGHEWKYHPEVFRCNKHMFNRGEYKHLTRERILLEIEKAIKEPHWNLFFGYLTKQVFAQRFEYKFDTIDFVDVKFKFVEWDTCIAILTLAGASKNHLRAVEFKRWLNLIETELEAIDYGVRAFAWKHTDWFERKIKRLKRTDLLEAHYMALQLKFSDIDEEDPRKAKEILEQKRLDVFRKQLYNV